MPTYRDWNRRRRRHDPMYQAMRNLFDGHPAAPHTARLLVDNGVTTPEELKKAPYADLRSIPGMGRNCLLLATQTRRLLREADPDTDYSA